MNTLAIIIAIIIAGIFIINGIRSHRKQRAERIEREYDELLNDIRATGYNGPRQNLKS